MVSAVTDCPQSGCCGHAGVAVWGFDPSWQLGTAQPSLPAPPEQGEPHKKQTSQAGLRTANNRNKQICNTNTVDNDNWNRERGNKDKQVTQLLTACWPMDAQPVPRQRSAPPSQLPQFMF